VIIERLQALSARHSSHDMSVIVEARSVLSVGLGSGGS
jgi:hypothetical protein